jgi:lambda family phage minor tail protein L
MGVRIDSQQLGALEVIELFVFDDTGIGGTNVIRWSSAAGLDGLSPIVWQGQEYQPYPIETEGFEQQGSGKLPRPTLRVSNIGGEFGSYLRSMKDALGAKVTRKRTLGKYLDAVNFPDAGNPYADPTTAYPDEIFFIARKAQENSAMVEMELAVAFDVNNVLLPRRQVIAGTCQWRYRSAECSYAGPPVQDINGNPTSDPAKDRCRKNLAACRARFGNGILKSSTFPGSTLNRT